ncbi:uncharacterized protein LOC118756464 [Rhagoletis pomonella]|uniref:uncharacterized protein LOC118756464 n=1 Tax=Rhagoletis pomonella TaxID=28610 RepID=UPI00178729CF|nr:uncharacterized protein LOC118756464 [Rhagoletis pomonella]
MKLIFLAIATVLLCSLISSGDAAPRRRIIRIRIIRIIPVRRGRRDVSEQTTILPVGVDYSKLADGKLIATSDPDTLIYKHNAEEGDVTQLEIVRLCDSVRQQVKQTTGEDVDFEVQVQPNVEE